MNRLTAALAIAALAGCAGHRAGAPRDLLDAELSSAPPRQVALAGFARLLENDPAGGGRRFDEALRRDGADPWARLGSALLARRGLDEAEEARHLLLLVQRAPAHPLSASVCRRLGDLAERSPALAEAVEAGLAAAAPRLEGLAAIRARAARAQAAEAVGDGERAARLRAENGSVIAWTLVGPFSAYHALELDRTFPPEQGPLPARIDGPPGVGPAAARALQVPDGVVSLEPEPATRGDVFYLAADLTAARGGDYLVAVGAVGSALAWLDGAPVAVRRVHAGFPPSTQVVPFRLAAGPHRLLVKLARGAAGPSRLAVALARADGAASDVVSAPAAPGAPASAVLPGAPPAPVNLAGALLSRLEPEAGPAVARLVAAREAMDSDREAAKALVEEALAAHPRAATLLLLRAEAQADDGTLGERTARARAEASLERALAADPGDASARLARAEFMRMGDRLDDAQAELSAVPEAAARRPRVLLARARVALARGFAEGAEVLAEEAQRGSGSCAAGELLLEQAQRRDEAARADELARALVRCPGGRERLAEHLRRRGEAAGSRDLLLALARAAPARVDRRLELARALAAAGDPSAAAAELADLARLWPREARIEKRRADFLELAGDRAAARAAREQALRLDGGDLGLRRLLDRERGVDTLADLAEDGRAAWEAWRKDGLKDASGVYALDHAAVEAGADGSLLERTHQVVAVLDQRAVDRFGEVPLPQGAELLLARTLKPDGRILEAEERGEKGTVSLPGLEPGDAAEFAWLRAIPSRGPALPGFTTERFYFRGDLPMWRSAYAVAAPEGTALLVDARRMAAPPVAREGGREVLRASAGKVPAFHAEPGTPAESEYLPMVHVGAGAGPELLGPALADALADCCRPTLEVARLAREVAASLPAGRTGSEALARAAYARVAEVVQGQGGPLADQASQVLARGRGARILLLAAVLEALGIRARLALAREFVRDPGPSSFPRTDAFAHPLLRVELEGGRVAWLDPSFRQVPFGALPPAVRGAEAVVIAFPGEPSRWERVPPDEGAPERQVRLAIRLAADGSAEVEGSERFTGFEGASTKASLERLDPQRRREAMEQLLSRGFRGATLSDLAFEGEGDAEAPLTIRWKLEAPGWARAGAGRLVADVPLQAARLSARFAQRGAREAPLLVGNPERFTLVLEVTPPPGFGPVPREGAEVRAPYGRYRRVERVQGGKLLRDDDFALERGRIPPGEWGAFGDFAAGVDEAQAAPMVFLGTSPGVAATPRAGSAKWAGALGMGPGRGGHGP